MHLLIIKAAGLMVWPSASQFYEYEWQRCTYFTSTFM